MTKKPEQARPAPINPTSKGSDQKTPGLAIASLILGLIGLIPIIGITPAILAIIFGIIVLGRKNGGRGLAIAGIAIGVLGLVITAAIVILIITIASKAAEDPAAAFKLIPGLEGCVIEDPFSCEATANENSISLTITNEQMSTTTINNAEAETIGDLTDPETMIECSWQGEQTISRGGGMSITLDCEADINPESLIAATITYKTSFGNKREASLIIIPE